MASQPKHSPTVRQNVSVKPKNQENSNPNLTTPPFKSSPSSSFRGSKTIHKSAAKNPTFISPKKKIRERKFVVAKKTNNPKKQNSDVNCKCKDKINGKCLCVAYENLRVSQDDFFKSRGGGSSSDTVSEAIDRGICEPEDGESPKGLGFGSSTMKRRRDLLLEEARESVPESGKVLHLVKAFERLLTLPKKTEQKDEETEKNVKNGINWALPGLQQQQESPPMSTFFPGEYSFTAESLGFDAQVSSSVDSSRRSSTGSRRSRRRSGSISSETVRKWKLQQKQEHRVTSLRPFKLRTEQRGKAKEEEFVKKLQEMMVEEEKQRIPLAQGLPWTTDEPECLVKPPVKTVTRPIDLKLHSDVRAVERAEFDCQVAEKMTLIEQYKTEKARQQKLEEEEEIRRLRKELVPKAQPMPYFDRPFIPTRRSVKTFQG